MQRPARNTVHDGNAMAQEVKVSRIIPESKKNNNVTHIYPQPLNAAKEEIHNDESQKRKNVRNGHEKNELNLKKLLEFAKDDEFIILAVIALLIIEGTGDVILLIALGYLLISDK